MHKIPIQIRFSDIDRLGHVNNSIYNQYFDVARVDYLNKTIRKFIDWNDKTVVIVHFDCDFIIPTLIEDTVFVESKIVKVSNRSFEMHQQIVDNKGNIKVKSHSVMSTFDMKANASFPFPYEWRKVIEDFEKEMN
jgi:acyl-CoA thioester hydrolase